MTIKVTMTEREKNIMANASAFALMLALEFGVRCAEKGMSLDEARALLIKTVTNELGDAEKNSMKPIQKERLPDDESEEEEDDEMGML